MVYVDLVFLFRHRDIVCATYRIKPPVPRISGVISWPCESRALEIVVVASKVEIVEKMDEFANSIPGQTL